MGTFTAKDVKELRERTGAGMMDCKKALEACDGIVEDSVDWLRKKGLAAAAKKSRPDSGRRSRRHECSRNNRRDR